MKPANVMLKPDGNVTLIDFGTAREFKKQNVEDTVCLGTLGYAAPEQFGGHGQTDGRTDIYCLGATLYHLVTGMNPCEPPYEIKPIREINARLSEGLEQIILKCTQKDPERRYQNCAELMYDLQEYNNIDKKHIKIKKKKLAVFSASVGLSAVMAITGFVTQQSGIKLKQETYSSKIESGNQEDNVEKAEEDYLDAIEIDSTKTEAYEQLVTLYQKDEEVTQEEFQKLEAELDVDSIEKGDSFGQLCYEMGELYWDYYTYDSTTKMKSTKRWMDLAEEYGNNQFADNEQLKIDAYRVIAQFYIDVLQNDPKDEKKENAGDQWKDYWNNLKSIIQQMQTEVKNAARGRVVLLDTYKISIQAVTVYGNYIKQSVSLEEMTEFIQEIETGLQELDLSGENNIKTRDELLLEVQKANVKIQAMEDKEEAQ
jgi:serine/threonine-protein kinase